MTSAAFITGSGAAEPAKPANFQEVLSLVRSNLAGMNAAELDSLALDGLLEKLKGRVALASDSADADAPGSLTRTNTFDDAFAYWRVSRVGPGVAGQFKESLDKLSGEKKLKGLVLDLRFAKGSDYAAATAVADLFVTAAKPQIEVGGKTFSSTAKDKAVVLPVAVLVNRQTSGAAEALAALVRLNRIGLLIGGATAGEASQFKEFPLSNGQRLRVSTGVIRLADSSPLLPTGVQPDIAVNVSLADEKLFIEDAFRDLKAASPSASTSVNSTNGARKRLNEAELVRRRREGLSEDEDAPDSRVRMSEQARPLVRDPALARALDLLKGLAVVGRARPL
ncbi:MAG: hypothetical protein HY300_08500 [Verrucomicrobia bacterium]|nr:hypothetical protein [Verrucomicrobiota bacterium]